MDKEKIPTEETIQKTFDAAELNKEQIKKRLEALENTQEQIITTLAKQALRIDECSVQR